MSRKPMTLPKPLPRRQSDVMRHILDFRAENGFPPTYRQLAKRMGIAVSRVQEHVRVLHEKGFLVRPKGIARGLRVLRNPDGTAVRS